MIINFQYQQWERVGQYTKKSLVHAKGIKYWW